jgi:tetratricopeptide (TPR) repeat protein
MWCPLTGCDEQDEERKKKKARRHLTKGKELFSSGKLDQALAHYRAACKKHPKSAKAQNFLGMALRYKFYETGDQSYRAKELEAFDTAVHLDQKWVVARINLATTLWEMGRRKEAAEEYGKALELDEDHPDRVSIRSRIKAVEDAATETREAREKKGEV